MMIIAPCLLLGTVVNVVVAWGCERAGGPFEMRYRWEPISAWPHAAPAHWPSPQGNAVGTCRWATSERIVSRRSRMENADGTIDGFYILPEDFRVGAVMYRTSVGFPCRSLESWSNRDDIKAKPATEVAHGFFTITLPVLGPTALAYVPVWPGFAINTLMYAAIIWILWRFPAMLRARFRIRRCLCAHCGYALAGLTAGQPCPECGKARPT